MAHTAHTAERVGVAADKEEALSQDWGCETGRRYFQAGFPVEVETRWPGPEDW
jgi:hypothetical protein